MPEQTHARAETAAATAAHHVDIDHELTKGFAARLIRRKAKQLTARAGFSKADREDLEQEMKLRVWQRLPQFDPAKAHWNAFVTTVVERHVATILQSARRRKRFEDNPHVSLSEMVEDCDSQLVELADTLGPQHKEFLTGRYVETAENLSDLKLEVDEVIAALPDELHRLCELLKVHNIQDAAREMGIPRSTAWSMVTRLRGIFVEAGIGDFLPHSSARRGETR